MPLLSQNNLISLSILIVRWNNLVKKCKNNISPLMPFLGVYYSFAFGPKKRKTNGERRNGQKGDIWRTANDERRNESQPWYATS
jgi:hypothetical protein